MNPAMEIGKEESGESLNCKEKNSIKSLAQIERTSSPSHREIEVS